MASPDCEVQDPLLVAWPEPAVAVGLAVELPLVAVPETSILEDASPELPPSPEPPLVASGLEVTVPDVPLFFTVPEVPEVAVPPVATVLELPLVPLVLVPLGPELDVPVPPASPPLPVPAVLLTVLLSVAGVVPSASATTAVAAANTIPSAAAPPTPNTRRASLARELIGAPEYVCGCAVSMELREPSCPITFVSILENFGTRTLARLL